jgi:hypothetical protein
MADRRRGEIRQLKRDQQLRRETTAAIGAEIVNEQHNGAQYRNPNRDQTRGDWDRTGRRTDEERSRDDNAPPGDDGLKAE